MSASRVGMWSVTDVPVRSRVSAVLTGDAPVRELPA